MSTRGGRAATRTAGERGTAGPTQGSIMSHYVRMLGRKGRRSRSKSAREAARCCVVVRGRAWRCVEVRGGARRCAAGKGGGVRRRPRSAIDRDDPRLDPTHGLSGCDLRAIHSALRISSARVALLVLLRRGTSCSPLAVILKGRPLTSVS
jgi:hypothetical protein